MRTLTDEELIDALTRAAKAYAGESMLGNRKDALEIHSLALDTAENALAMRIKVLRDALRGAEPRPEIHYVVTWEGRIIARGLTKEAASALIRDLEESGDYDPSSP